MDSEQYELGVASAAEIAQMVDKLTPGYLFGVLSGLIIVTEAAFPGADFLKFATAAVENVATEISQQASSSVVD